MNSSFTPFPPLNFTPSVKIAGCYCLCDKRILLLKRHPNKPYGETWGVPAGKMEMGEDARTCAVRETFEETGIDIQGADLKQIETLHCRIPALDFVYHMFYKPFASFPVVDLGTDEHTEYRWVTYEEALQLPLIIGGEEALTLFHLMPK